MTGGKTLRTILLLLGLGLLTWLVYRLGPGRIFSMLLQIGWHFAALGIIHALYQAVRSASLSGCLLGIRVPYRDVLRIRISGEAVRVLTSTGPLLAEPAKAWLLKKKGLEFHRAFAATFSEILFYNLSGAVLSVGGFLCLALQYPLQPTTRGFAWIVILLLSAFLGVAVFAFARRFYVFHFILRQLTRLPRLCRKVKPHLDKVRQMEDCIFSLVYDRPSRFLMVVGLELAAQVLLILELYWILAVLGDLPPLIHPLLIETASKFVSLAFVFVPLQLGVAEGSYAFVVTLLGLPAAIGVTISIIRRLRSLLVTGVGLLCLWVLSER